MIIFPGRSWFRDLRWVPTFHRWSEGSWVPSVGQRAYFWVYDIGTTDAQNDQLMERRIVVHTVVRNLETICVYPIDGPRPMVCRWPYGPLVVALYQSCATHEFPNFI